MCNKSATLAAQRAMRLSARRIRHVSIPRHAPAAQAAAGVALTRLWGGSVHAGHGLLALLALVVILLGLRAVAVLGAPLPAFPPMTDPAVADRQLLASSDPFFPGTPMGEDLPVTSLPLSLHGVRADAATGRGTAIIALADGQQLVFTVGEMLTEGVRLVQVSIDHVVIERDGTRESLWLASPGGGEAAAAIPADPMAVQGMFSQPAPAAPTSEPDDSRHLPAEDEPAMDGSN
jgi:general secretion pathway protein C